MIAALFLVALVASAQAYPGRDPLEEALSVKSENNNLLTNFGNPTTCLITKIFEVKAAFDEAKKDIPLVLSIIPQLNEKIASCKNSDDDWLNCRLQAIRDTWEGSADLRKQLQVGGQKILKALQDVLACLQEGKVQARSGAIRIQTLPARIEQ